MSWPRYAFFRPYDPEFLSSSKTYRDDPSEEDKNAEVHGHVNSISVLRSYRRLGLAKKLMLLSRMCYLWILISTIKFFPEEAMASIYKASYVSLHVRKSNKAAIALYRDTLGFEVAKVEKKYCKSKDLSTPRFFALILCLDGDGEDALSMRLSLKNT